MRGVNVHGNRLRQIRQARGLTQQELARLAGVGERTVRNAEMGRRVRLDFLRFLAAALDIEVADVVDDREELRVALCEQRRVEHILSAIDAHAKEQDHRELFGLVSPDLVVSSPGPESVPYLGEYHGRDGLQMFFDRAMAVIEYQQMLRFSRIRTGGNLVVIDGFDWLRVIPTGKSISTPWMHVYEFDNGHIARLDLWSDVFQHVNAFQPG